MNNGFENFKFLHIFSTIHIMFFIIYNNFSIFELCFSNVCVIMIFFDFEIVKIFIYLHSE